ncbi:uncharacterized protein LOC143422125 isoform X2 [Xylocopa sonorina]|uniref:uncharacterized protein LOC143422125 isoform X2 n=1 Tax=Xylocopa sonorina TaxID=1818115 RepID=UPI00403AD951
MKETVILTTCLLGIVFAGSPRLPRTSADERNTRNVSNNGGNVTGNTMPAPSRNSQRNREQYLFNVFEVIVSTLESKLQRIENLDKAVEHLMRRVEALDSRMNDNIDKTDAVITKLRTLDLKLFNSHPTFSPTEPVYPTRMSDDKSDSEIRSGSKLHAIQQQSRENPSSETLGEKLLSLDQKVSDIDHKLVNLKNQLDSNFLQNDDINAEASEKKPVSMSVIEITKAMSNEFHVNLVSDRLGTIYNMMTDVHDAILVRGTTNNRQILNTTKPTTTTTESPPKQSKIDRIVEQMYPMLTVSEKMDQVWNVVVGTKSSVDDLLPKSDELLTQTQRQERAINEIRADLRLKTNKIIENLEGVENRLRKQEDDVASLAQRPIPAELLLDPTIDRLVEYDSSRYVGASEDIPPETTVPPVTPTTIVSSVSMSMSSSTSSNTVATNNFNNSNSIVGSSNFSNSTASLGPSPSSSSQRPSSKNRGVIFPSVKNKPSPANSTFTTDAFLSYKDVKGYSCVDLLNAGMRDSGVYYLQIRGTTYWFLKVYCEQDIAEGGWTIIQRRDDFGEPRENFNRDWADYKNGFGDPAREFWLGNENIYMLTNNEDYMLRVELEDFEGNKRYAQYSHFKIYSEAEYYKLEIDGYDGNAGDSLNDPWYGSNNSPFSTYNRDNDRSSLNCASMLKGGWWWKSCGRGLNGLYLNDPQDLTARQGIVWFRWRGWDYTLKRATMMIKPKGPTTTTTTTTTMV